MDNYSCDKYFNNEKNRLETFKSWKISFIDKNILALLGFYYLGIEDRVKCNFCGIEIYMWERGDDILSDHLKWSPTCKLICRKYTDNIPIDVNILNLELNRNKNNQYIYTNNSVSEGSIESINHDTDVCGLETYSTNISYDSKFERLCSYNNWPSKFEYLIKSLYDSGFYCIGNDDEVKCFKCGLCLKNWIHNTNALSQVIDHDCNICKNNDFNTSDENKKFLCSICLENNITHMIIPCNHASFCEECINKIYICPICRKQKTDIMRIYIQ